MTFSDRLRRLYPLADWLIDVALQDPLNRRDDLVQRRDDDGGIDRSKIEDDGEGPIAIQIELANTSVEERTR